MPGLLTPENVVPRLRGRLGRPYRFVERTASTQRLLGEDDPEGAVAVADEQTEGRGRLGRQWLPPAGTSPLLSVPLRPDGEPGRLPGPSPLPGRAPAGAVPAAGRPRARGEVPDDARGPGPQGGGGPAH